MAAGSAVVDLEVKAVGLVAAAAATEALSGRARGTAAGLAKRYLGRSTCRTRSMARGRAGTRSLKGPKGLPRRTTVFARLP